MIYIEILHGIVPPPAAPAWNVVRSWGDVERQLGVALPDDYKELVGSYGAGAFDAFIWLLNPLTTNEYLNLIVQRDVRLRAHAEFAAEFAAPYRGFDGSGGLLPCAFTDNGDVVYWNVRGVPGRWQVVVQGSRASTWQDFQVSLTEFLVGVLRRELICSSFPNGFPPVSHTFTVSVR